jgi:hypothetical protein
MKACCVSMQQAVWDQGQRGFSVRLPDELDLTYTGNMPHIIFRAYDEGQDDHVHISTNIPVTVRGEIGFRFCPWCGEQLTS